MEREERGKGEGKGGGREWRVKTCCPMSNKLSPPNDYGVLSIPFHVPMTLAVPFLYTSKCD